MNKKNNNFFIIFFLLLGLGMLLISQQAFASPYGAGKYGVNVPYGGQTSLTISTSGNIAIPITPTTSGVLSSTTGTVTVVSSDVVGYKLYVRSLTNSNLVNGATTIASSGNVSAAALSTNTWGYNTDASTNFVGLTTTDTLIRSLTGPATSGDITSVTYGLKLDLAQASGSYANSVIYTAVPQTN